MALDETDSKIVQYLMMYGRATWAELASILDLSAPGSADRVRRLEERGIIKGYAALVDPESIGCRVTAFIAVTLERPEHRVEFLKRVHELPEIQECHHVAGDDDYLLKVRCLNTSHLDHVISDQLKGLQGILRTRTMIVLSSLKETPVLPPPAINDGNLSKEQG